MKPNHLSKIAGAGVLATSLTILPLTLPAQAQTNTSPDNSGTASSQNVDNERGDRDFDWGWLGLLGLAGLAGLAGRKHQEPVAYREPDVVNRGSIR